MKAHSRLAGIRISTLSRTELVDAMVADCRAARSDQSIKPKLVFDANGHGISMFHSEPEFRYAVERADIVHADGGFLVTLSRWFGGARVKERSATTDMIHDFAVRAVNEGLSFYLLGGEEVVNRGAAEELLRLYPGLRIAGRRNGYFLASDEASVVEDINAANPDVVWVGLGKPFEQLWSVRNRDRIDAGWVVTCGGCYNYITGHYKRAPSWMQRLNLEWLHRMVMNPRKLFWRYLVSTPHALALVVAMEIGRLRSATERVSDES